MYEIIEKLRKNEDIKIENKETYLKILFSDASFIHIEEDSISLIGSNSASIYHYRKKMFLENIKYLYFTNEKFIIKMDENFDEVSIIFLMNLIKIKEIYDPENFFKLDDYKKYAAGFCLDILNLINRKFIELEKNKKNEKVNF